MQSFPELRNRAQRKARRVLRAKQRQFSRRSGQPRVLLVVDVEGWAHDFKAQNLRRFLSDEFEVVVVAQKDVVQRDLDDADLVLVFYWKQLEILLRSDRIPHSKILIGVCSHGEFDDSEVARRGLELIGSHARMVFVNNLLLERECRAVMPSDMPIHYTPNGVDTSFFEPRSVPTPRAASEQLTVGWAGSLSNHGSVKGYADYVVPATEQAGVRLLTAAREDRWRSHAEMRDFYRSLDVYVCASESEGTPNPCLEAAACGVPLVTTAVGNMPEFVRHGDNGLVITRDVDVISGALSELAANSARLTDMARAVRETALDWDWKHQAEPYRRLFRDALGDGGRDD